LSGSGQAPRAHAPPGPTVVAPGGVAALPGGFVMRKAAGSIVALSLIFAMTAASRSGDDQAAALMNRVIKAHFPKGLDTKNKGVRTKSKGTLKVMGLELEFSQEVSVQAPKFKEAMELTVMNKTVKVTTVYNGKEGWVRAGDKDVPVNEEMLAEFKEVAYMMTLMHGAFAKDKNVKYAVAGEVQVKGKPATGLTISREGKKDITLFVDNKTGLITKVEMRKRDLMSGQEVTEERFVAEYQERFGRMMPKKIEMLRDGNQFLSAEVVDVEIVEKLDDSEFERPQ
jgi:hypothetical protein